MLVRTLSRGVVLALTALSFCLAAGIHAQSITGKVLYAGPEFRLRAVRMNADPKCEELHKERVFADNRLVSDDQGVANVFVYVEGVEGTFETPTQSVQLGQEGCLYTPRVLGLMLNQPLEISNGDPTTHNVRCLGKRNRPFNVGQPEGTPPRTKTFNRPEMALKIKCDIHPWMSAYVFVMEHPYFAVTKADGSFTIDGLPPGRHTIKAWHETFGELMVEADSGSDKSIEFTFAESE